MTSNERAELLKLLAILCDQQLSDAEQSRLEDVLSYSAEARRTYLQYVDLHSRLLMHPGLTKGRRMPPSEAWARAALEEAVGLEGRAAAWNAHRRGWWTWQRMATYVGVAAATLAATLLLQLALHRPELPAVAMSPAAWPADPPQYIATLSQTTDAQWDEQHSALGSGSRLLPGGLTLVRGLARIHFDSGVDLVVEGPAELRLESVKSAELKSGKIVFLAEGSASPFSLRTPSSTLVDIGTEYGVEVRPQREELHVFTGEVQREPLKKRAAEKSAAETSSSVASAAELVLAGEARWYAADSRAGQPTPLAPERFVHELPSSPPPQFDPTAGLLAYEGFSYPTVTDFKDGKGAGGSGWIGAWELVWAKPHKDRAQWTLNVGAGLARPDVQASIGGSFEYAGQAKYRRRLAAPVRLDADGVYFLSYLFRREGPASGRGIRNFVGLQFREEADLQGERSRRRCDPRKQLSVGVERSNELFTSLQRESGRAMLPLSYKEPYLVVAKIVASANNPDQVFVRAYGIEEPVSREEPETWSVVGPGHIHSHLKLEWLEIEIDSWRLQTLDELRLGSSWAAVAGPYVTAQPAAVQPSN